MFWKLPAGAACRMSWSNPQQDVIVT